MALATEIAQKPSYGALEAALASAERAFREGRLSEAEALVQPIDPDAADAAGLSHRFDFLLFGLACYRMGDTRLALRRHDALPPEELAAIRYRMLIEHGRLSAARRVRRAASHEPEVEADFRWTLSRAALWSHRLDRGLRLYDARIQARNFTRILPRWLRHDPRIADQLNPEAVVLEQGLGDVLFHIAQMLKLGVAPRRVFGLGRQARMVEAVWPDAEFADLANGPGPHEFRGVACSGDWLAKRWARDGTLGGLEPIEAFMGDGPRRGFGICWRGGSGQNRREEREVPLQFMLDLLPRNRSYLALQHELRPAEIALIDGREDLMRPTLDLTGDDLATLRAISRLEGVVTVDSANLHMAGLTGAPALAMMNPRSHWYWGEKAEVGDVFAGCATVSMAELDGAVISDWVDGATRQPAPPIVRRDDWFEQPVFITGAPRSRTSLVAGALAAGGLRLGATIGPTAENPDGFFENRKMREEVLKPLLANGGYDPLGVADLPPTRWRPTTPWLRDAVASRLPDGREGEDDDQQVWGYKDPKLLLAWRAWAGAFPKATWIIVERSAKGVAESCARTSFMRRHSRSAAFWTHFARSYAIRSAELTANREGRVATIDTDTLLQNRRLPAPAREKLANLGLEPDRMEAWLADHIRS